MRHISMRPVLVAAATLLVLVAFSFRLSLAQAPSATTIALTGARLIDGTGRAPLEQATLVISNGRVQAVGAPGAVQIPAGAVRVDVSGKTIIPGLVNAHAHVRLDEVDEQNKAPVRAALVDQLRLYAKYGVTTAVSLGSSNLDDERESLRLRDEQARGMLDGARGKRADLVVLNANPLARHPQHAAD